MSLLDRPDFQLWLERFERQHDELHGAGRQPAPDRCDGCGEAIAAPVSSTGLCLVCLAESYGRDRSRAAARIAGALRTALVRDGDLPAGDVREAVEEILDDYERSPA